MAEPFRWKNSYADVVSSGYGDLAQSYLGEVVEPAVASMERRIAELNERGQNEDPVAIFLVGPAEELLRATLTGYCLSIQSLWEKQIRAYLQRCAEELARGSTLFERTRTANWQDLNRIFEELRGVPLTAFDEFADLDLLQLLGNVCRHGDGPSLQRLAIEHPELWPARECELAPPPRGSPAAQAFRADDVSVSLTLLRRLTDAIASFWRETEYIYKESIHRKHPSLEAALVEERRARAGRGRPWDP